MSESTQLEFARIDRDLSYLMDTFSHVLNDTGDVAVARALPWRAGAVHGPITDNDTVMALSLQVQALEEARARLSLSSILQPVPSSLLHKIDTLASLLGDKVYQRIRERNPNEPWRQVTSLLLERMPDITSSASGGSSEPLSERSYRFAHQLTEDLRDIRESLCEIGAERIAQSDIDPLIRSVEVFGFHLAALDIRQNSGLHEIAISQILDEAGWKDSDFKSWSEEKRIAFFLEQLERASPLVNPLTLTGREALTAVGALREFTVQRDNFGDEGSCDVPARHLQPARVPQAARTAGVHGFLSASHTHRRPGKQPHRLTPLPPHRRPHAQ